MCCVCLLLLSAPWKTVKPMSDVPRVARSVDDLRVGMVVIRRFSDGWASSTLTVCAGDLDPGPSIAGDLFSESVVEVVILSDAPDPPARDWSVPATQMEALGAALEYKGIWSVSPKDYEAFAAMRDAARAVLDAAREVEHE